MVVPKIATRVARKGGSKLSFGMNVAFNTSSQSGRAKKADPTYANNANASHLKVLAIRRYEPQSCNARITSAIGKTRMLMGTGTRRFIAAAIAPISAPAFMVFAITNKDTVRYKSFLA